MVEINVTPRFVKAFTVSRSPWQRGTNENTNRLLRQYLHRNADLATFTQDELNAVAAKLNHRPRRVLGWATPAEAFGIAEPKPMLRASA